MRLRSGDGDAAGHFVQHEPMQSLQSLLVVPEPNHDAASRDGDAAAGPHGALHDLSHRLHAAEPLCDGLQHRLRHRDARDLYLLSTVGSRSDDAEHRQLLRWWWRGARFVQPTYDDVSRAGNSAADLRHAGADSEHAADDCSGSCHFGSGYFGSAEHV